MERFLVVCNPNNPSHADVLCDALERQNISVILSYEGSGANLRLMVPERHFARASEIIQRLSPPPETDTHDAIESAALRS